ncbi:MAG: aldehyde dehydrogenase family protein, partial [Steroidobacteraceae bacterium]
MASSPLPFSASSSAALVGHWIGGQPLAGDGARADEVFDPATGKVARRVALADAALIDRAVASAAAAWPAWADTP